MLHPPPGIKITPYFLFSFFILFAVFLTISYAFNYFSKYLTSLIYFTFYFFPSFHTGSEQLLVQDLFRSRITRTGSLAPSARQQRSRRTTVKKSTSPLEFFKRLRGGNKEGKKAAPITVSEKRGPLTLAHHFRVGLVVVLLVCVILCTD